MSVSVITYGATIWKLLVKDRGGIPEDVVCGFDTLEEYTQSDLALGALCVGRPASGAAGDATLFDGFHRVIWRVVDEGTDFNEGFVRLQHVSGVDGAELTMELTITLTGYVTGHSAYYAVATRWTLRRAGLVAQQYDQFGPSNRRTALLVVVVFWIGYSVLQRCVLCHCMRLAGTTS
jgi:hypothetical protein